MRAPRWSWLSPAVGLALLVALAGARCGCRGRARPPSSRSASSRRRASRCSPRSEVRGLEDVLRIGVPVALAAALAASLPFIVEGRFGILGTGLNPDMSQHLLRRRPARRRRHGAADLDRLSARPALARRRSRRASGSASVKRFGGLTLAIGRDRLARVARPARRLLAPWRRIVRARCSSASPTWSPPTSTQGAFKETMQALFVLAFALGLHELEHRDRGLGAASRCDAVPLAALAVGAVYTYSFPGLLWLAGAAAIWAWPSSAPLARRAARGGRARVRAAAAPAGIALAFARPRIAPEIGRMVDFASFETFDPNGAGLGNLFGQISPFEALGIWPSGDFRLDPGDGAVPAVGYYLGAAFAADRARLRARRGGCAGASARSPAALAAAVAPVRLRRRRRHALPGGEGDRDRGAAGDADRGPGAPGGEPLVRQRSGAIAAPAGLADLRAARIAGSPRSRARVAFCSRRPLQLLALANGPVGPTTYSPALTELRRSLAAGSTLVLAPPSAARRRARARLPRLGAARRPGLHRAGEGTRRELPRRRRAGRSPAARPPAAADLRPRRPRAPRRRTRSGSDGRAGSGHGPCPLIAVRRPRRGDRRPAKRDRVALGCAE